jgi:hypothetical protein
VCLLLCLLQNLSSFFLSAVYSETSSREILQVVAEQHGIELSSVKSDLYTVLNIDSKHPSKMRSTIWQPKELGLDKPQLKVRPSNLISRLLLQRVHADLRLLSCGLQALTDAYWAAHATPSDDTPANSFDGVSSSKRKQPPALSVEETKAKETKAKK